MYGFLIKPIPINKATGERSIFWIVFYDFTVLNGMENFMEGQTVVLGFFIGMVGDANTVNPDCSVYPGYLQQRLLDAYSPSLPGFMMLAGSRARRRRYNGRPSRGSSAMRA
jgi:hypothetical protein